MSYKITWKTHAICFSLSYLICILMESNTDNIVTSFFVQDFVLQATPFPMANLYIGLLILMVPITIVHEAIHGAAYMLFGGTVKFGFKFVYAYTQEISQNPIDKWKFWIILLASTLIISALTLLLPEWLGRMVALLNLVGATGDIYMSIVLLIYKRDCKIIDRRYGFDVV